MISLPKYIGYFFILISIFFSISFYNDFLNSEKIKFNLLNYAITSIGLALVFHHNLFKQKKINSNFEKQLSIKIIPLLCFILLSTYLSYLVYYSINGNNIIGTRNIFFTILSYLIIFPLIYYIITKYIVAKY
ncbi:Uncharacterised protein [Candidatus Ornithobacterium hominis]|nr:Uncharacterised protein [Candidatus Ornithobacterium hominis]